MKIVARVIAYLFHPLLLTTYLVLLLGHVMPRFLMIPPPSLWKFAGFVFVITAVFPVANLYVLKTFGSISSMQMVERRDRILPFTMVAIFYGVISFLFFYKIGANVNFNRVMLIVASMAALTMLITFFYKVSVHSLAMGGAAGMLLPLNKLSEGDLIWPTAVTLVIGGLVMSSRLYLQVHNPREVLTGATAGLVSGFLGMILLF